MKEFVILSGKGGTGKTSFTAAFAQLANTPVVCDADVDAADLHLLLQPEIQKREEFRGGGLAQISDDVCTSCGMCRDLCKFEAISDDFKVDGIRCEGCGVCVDLCPEQAIDFPLQKSGEWYVSQSRVGPMIHAQLGIAEENSGKLVSVVRQQARKIAEQGRHEVIITDGPPGIGCPVIAAMSGADKIIIVVEPTLSGTHDFKRLISLSKHFNLPAMLCVNRYDINEKVAWEIEKAAEAEGVRILPRVPFDQDFVRAMVVGQTVLEYIPASQAAQCLRDVWEAVLSSKEEASPGIQIPRFLNQGDTTNEGNANSCSLQR